MGNAFGGKRRTAKVMKVDGTAFPVKPPARAADVLRDHPGFALLQSEEVKQLGLRAQPLDPDAPLKPGKLYFLVELPRFADKRAPRRAWSGALQVSAKDRLEGLLLARRSTSDLSLAARSSTEVTEDGGVRLRMRLPKAQVARLMEESRDAAEAAAKIMELCVSREDTPTRTPDRRSPLAMNRTPERSSPLASSPGWDSPLPRTSEWRSPLRRTAPEWRCPLPTTPEHGLPDVNTRRKEKRTRFVALPDEIIA